MVAYLFGTHWGRQRQERRLRLLGVTRDDALSCRNVFQVKLRGAKPTEDQGVNFLRETPRVNTGVVITNCQEIRLWIIRSNILNNE